VSEELEVLKTVGRRLDDLGIPYMITGSMAVNYYAVPRMTRDIDLVVELSGGDAGRFRETFQDDFWRSRCPRVKGGHTSTCGRARFAWQKT
jgi:hypothetical protein